MAASKPEEDDEKDESASDDASSINSDADETTAMPTQNLDRIKGERKSDTVLGDFRLVRRLGKGGMAEVWLAEQESLKRNVALKLLRSELTEKETYVARFQTEAKAAAGLNHPNIVQVYTVGERNGQYFIAQEYVQGQTLKSVIEKKGPLEVKMALVIMRQVASALQAASERGIIHRDIKPENIMLTKKGEAKVADFGLAQLQGNDRVDLTQEGVTMGTPLYMSPEQVNGRQLDSRSDIYSFGITCYHMLAGHPPFQGENAISVAVKHLHESAIPLEEIRPDLPSALCKVIGKMTAKRPDQRYANAQEVLNDVRAISKSLKTGESVDHLIDRNTGPVPFPVKRPALVLPLLCTILAVCSAGAGFVMRPKDPEPSPTALRSAVEIKPSAREQYIHAMFLVDNEDAFQAVINEWPLDKVYTTLAREQLALMYLRDSSRHADAREQLSYLKNAESKELSTKARIGEIYLQAVNGDLTSARAGLGRLSADIEEHIPAGGWKNREADIREMIANESDDT